jgi:hypothetical protein
MSRCIECASFSLTGTCAKFGCGTCAHDPRPGFYVYALRDHECGKFAAAGDKAKAARRNEWRELRKGEK